MSFSMVHADSVAPQPWRNGGGQTRELLAWPDANNWQLRISRADIGADGPFSAFPGVTRWFSVLSGMGVALSFADGERILRRGDAPLQFDGASVPACRLLDGATQDLNLMARGGTALMQAVQAQRPWRSELTWRAIYTTVAGRWRAGNDTADLAADTLLWTSAAAATDWVFTSHDASVSCHAWWLGFTPAG